MHTQTGTREAISTSVVHHHGAVQVALHFPYDPEIRQRLQNSDGVRRAQTLRRFYITCPSENIRRLIHHCRGVLRVAMKEMSPDTSALLKEQGSSERNPNKPLRYITLSPVLPDVPRRYQYRQLRRPADYQFEGQKRGDPYRVGSAQTILNRAVGAAGINKEVTFHALRHSYATHLPEKGVDIICLNALPGHFDIKTTERYLHDAKDKLVSIPGSLDFLDRDI